MCGVQCGDIPEFGGPDVVCTVWRWEVDGGDGVNFGGCLHGAVCGGSVLGEWCRTVHAVPAWNVPEWDGTDGVHRVWRVPDDGVDGFDERVVVHGVGVWAGFVLG